MNEIFYDISQDDSLGLVACDRKKALFLQERDDEQSGHYFILDLQHNKIVRNFFVEGDKQIHDRKPYLKISNTKEAFIIAMAKGDNDRTLLKYHKIDLKTAQIYHIRTEWIPRLIGFRYMIKFVKKLNSKSLAVAYAHLHFQRYLIFHQKSYRKLHEIDRTNQFSERFFIDDRFFFKSEDNYFLEIADLSFRMKNLGIQQEYPGPLFCTSNREKSHVKMENERFNLDKFLEVREECGLKLVSRFDRKTQSLMLSNDFIVVTWKVDSNYEEKIYFDEFNLAVFRDFRIKTKVPFPWKTVAHVNDKRKIKALIAAKLNEFYLTFNEKKHRRLILKKGV